MNKKRYVVTGTMAILHNNQRYEQGDKLELTDEEAEKISLYVQLVEPKQAVSETDVQATEVHIAQAETKTKGKKGE